MKDEIYVITHDEMTRLKQNALNLLDKLPSSLKDALIIVEFMKKHIEESTGVKVKGINIKLRYDDKKKKDVIGRA